MVGTDTWGGSWLTSWLTSWFRDVARPTNVTPGRTISVAADTRTIIVAAETRTIEVSDPMEIQSFETPMHPKADHNYSVDFKKLFDGLGGDTIIGTPTITVEEPDAADRPGFTVTFVALTADLQSVIFNPKVDVGDQGDIKYQQGGQTMCIEVIVTTASGNTEPQQVHLKVSDQCKL